jgi:hypothetical protein
VKTLRRALGSWMLLPALVGVVSSAHATGPFECGGRVEVQTWELWKGQAKSLLSSALIHDGFVSLGDTYSLYDLQAYLHNLVAMAERCGRRDRLADIVSLLIPLFDQMTDVRGQGPGWICRGGRVCTASNGMLGNEVVLYSAQYLALLTGIAQALSALGSVDDGAHAFVRQTVRVAIAHLDRWSSEDGGLRTAERLAAKGPKAVRDASSRLFFTDADLWILTIAADVARTVRQRSDLAWMLDPDKAKSLRRNRVIADLSRLFAARLSLRSVPSDRLGGRVVLADIDRGYWRLHPDSRFAGYTGEEPPVACGLARFPTAAEGPAPREAVVDTIGWDFSHARRLVHAAGSLDRHRESFRSTYNVPEAALPPAGLSRAFAAQLVQVAWNGDAYRPLFSNFWDGSNGWYRVGHDRGAAGCFAGYPPFGLSDAFVTGGFSAWGVHFPVIGAMGRRLFTLAEHPDDAARTFLRRRYPVLSDDAPRSTRILTQLMFWPTLVQPAASP